MRVLDLFSGIGGFTLGLEMSKGDYDTVAFCERDTFCQQILKKHWVDTPIIEDIHNVTKDTLAQIGVGQVDLITAGFPCQPFSHAGKQKGTQDKRFLWTELFRVVQDVSPRFIILENVPGLLNIQNGLVFTGILYDLAQAGYDAEWQIIPASGIGAPHKRERLFIIAYNGRERIQGIITQAISKQPAFSWLEDVRGVAGLRNRPDIPAPLVWGNRNGIPDYMDRIKSLGNAVVPQVVEHIGNQLWEAIPNG